MKVYPVFATDGPQPWIPDRDPQQYLDKSIFAECPNMAELQTVSEKEELFADFHYPSTANSAPKVPTTKRQINISHLEKHKNNQMSDKI